MDRELEKTVVKKVKRMVVERPDTFLTWTQLQICVADELRREGCRLTGGKEHAGWDLVGEVWARYCERDPYWKTVTEKFKLQLKARYATANTEALKRAVVERFRSCGGHVSSEDIFAACRDHGLGIKVVRELAKAVNAEEKGGSAPQGPDTPEKRVLSALDELREMVLRYREYVREREAAAARAEDRAAELEAAMVGLREENARLALERSELERANRELSGEVSVLREHVCVLKRKNSTLYKSLWRVKKKLAERVQELQGLSGTIKILEDENRGLKKSLAEALARVENLRGSLINKEIRRVTKFPICNVHKDETSPFSNADMI